MAIHEFKAESKRLMDLMIGSIYTHREIFLRELISNASDAIDKLYFKSLTDSNVGMNLSDYEIRIDLDEENRTITITDNGIGMTKEELQNNLGTIAKSGSFQFKNENEKNDDINIIGQFGVGFYSAFMVAKEVTVISKAYGSDKAYKWQSQGSEGYTLESAQRDNVGTTIIMNLKDNTEEEDFDEFLDTYRIKNLITRYSDYIRYPIKMEVEKSRKKEDSDDYETYTEIETVNTMVPLWRKNKNEIKDEEYNDFYKSKFMDFEDPMEVIHTKTEGITSYDALMFIPSKTPFDYYTKEFQKGLQLYSNGVMIMDKCEDLLPDYFGFVKGLVDSADLSLNISREMLQHDRQLSVIAKSIEKKIKTELTKMLKNDREKYEKFWESFGRQLKFGAYENFGANKDKLQDLLMFVSSNENKLTTLDEYVNRMKPEQKDIYYACAENIQRAEHLPQVEMIKDKGFEILYLTEDVDEFCLKMIREYNEKTFKSVADKNLDLETKEEKEEYKKLEEENKDILEAIKTSLGDKVKSVKLTQRLKSHPVCITSDSEISLEMEKVLKAMPSNNGVNIDKVLEINPKHAVFDTVKRLHESKSEKFNDLCYVLYSNALLTEGLELENPSEFTPRLSSLIENI